MTHADLMNLPEEMTFEGKVYKFRQPDQIEQGLFQRWLEQRARDSIERSELPQDRKDVAQNLVSRDCAKGMYEWGGPEATAALWTPAGLAKIVSIVCADQGVDDELAEGIVRENIKRIAAVLISKVESDPKLLAQVTASLGLGSDFFSNNSRTRRSTGRSKNSSGLLTINLSRSTRLNAAPKRGPKSRSKKCKSGRRKK